MKSSPNELYSEYSEDAPTREQLNELIGDVILEFGAPWCAHCQLAEPIVQEVLKDYPDLVHIKLYDGKAKPLGRAFKVKLWPTLILLRNGKEIDRVVRPILTDDIRHLWVESKEGND